MFRTATAFAVAALFCAPALAQSVTKGQYYGVTQYTGLIDPMNICTGLGLAAGQVSTSVGTVTGLGATWSTTIANSNPGPGGVLGVSWINCGYSALPAASAFSENAFTGYTAAPASSTTSCVTTIAGNFAAYTLDSANNSTSTPPQTLSVSIVPTGIPGAVPAGAGSSFKVTTTNTALISGGNALCSLSTDSLYSLTN